MWKVSNSEEHLNISFAPNNDSGINQTFYVILPANIQFVETRNQNKETNDRYCRVWEQIYIFNFGS